MAIPNFPTSDYHSRKSGEAHVTHGVYPTRCNYRWFAYGLVGRVAHAHQWRIAGASGIFAGLLSLEFSSEFSWRLTFIVGMLIGAFLSAQLFFDASRIAFTGGRVTTVVAGLIVGIGTILGSGCTSGHGICGLSRFSVRSLAATLTFMVTAIVTVFITRHVWGA